MSIARSLDEKQTLQAFNFGNDTNLTQCSISELIEIVQQIEVGIMKFLPSDWQNPGIAGLFSYRLLADALHKQRESLASDVNTFLDKIDEISSHLKRGDILVLD